MKSSEHLLADVLQHKFWLGATPASLDFSNDISQGS